jgi:NAD(P)-dependent dehydrogenase (short-subunit alcohol dehydrogenase family)
VAERLVRDAAPDLIVLCAGAAPVLGPFHEQTWEQFSLNWHVDTKSAFVWLREALRAPMKRGGHVVVISSGAAAHGSPVSGGYAGAKRTQWFLADYAATEVERANLGLRVHCVLPALNPSTELGRAAIAAYAKRAGVTDEEFARRFGPPLTPAILGAAVVELVTAPDRQPQVAWRVSGNGLAPM